MSIDNQPDMINPFMKMFIKFILLLICFKQVEIFYNTFLIC